MTAIGWVIMLLSVGGTSGFFFWCVRRVLRLPKQTNKLHGVLDTELAIEEEERRQRAFKRRRT